MFQDSDVYAPRQIDVSKRSVFKSLKIQDRRSEKAELLAMTRSTLLQNRQLWYFKERI
jgi:hypothetical protein